MNNRQANGRRRGRGGQQRQGGGNPNGGNGSRIDNRARGNAAQLFEKYKNLASDAQRQGDRVNAEYYLQFADHYFRVLSESRARFEEQNPGQAQGQRRLSNATDDDGEDFDFESDGNRYEGDPQRQPQQDREVRADREPRQDRDVRNDREVRQDREPRQDREARSEREPRQDREARADREPRQNRRDRDDRGEPRRNGYANANGNGMNDNGFAAAEAPAAPEAPVAREEEEARPVRRRGRPRREEAVAEAPVGIDAALLPPAFGIEAIAPASEDGEEAPKKPRRRRTAKNDDVEVPAA